VWWLSREPSGFARVFEHLLRAGLADLEARETSGSPGGSGSPGASGSLEARVAHLREAVAHAEAQGMAMHRATAQHRLGHALGGDEGATLRDEAARWAREERIVQPERLFALVAPSGAEE
jgi:hypothetical protein